MRTLIPSLAIAALSVGLYLAGLLTFADRAFMEGRFALLQRDASLEIAIVAIDPGSLQKIGVWPWPREFHARLLDRLRELGVRRIGYDIDFSAQSTAEQDRRLKNALAAHSPPVILPAFRQFSKPQGSDELIASLPLPLLAQHATVASINVRPDSDGVVRRVEPIQNFDEVILPFMAARLATARDVRQATFYLDYGIRADTIPVYAFADVLIGGGENLAGRDILVGSTAVELGDQLAVPRYAALPGVVVQALAYESLVQNRALAPLPPWLVAFATLMVTMAALFVMAQYRWRGASLVLAAAATLVIGASFALQATAPTFVDVAPLLLAALLSYGVTLVRTIGRQEENILQATADARRWQRGLNAVFEASFDAVLRVGRRGEIRAMNRAAREQFGAREGMSVKDALPLPVGAIPGGDADESLAQREDGSFFSARVQVAEVDSDERIAVVHDSTEQKALQREATRFFNLSQDLVAVLDLQGRILRVNPSWRRTLGLDSANLVGSNFGLLFRAADARDLQTFLERRPQGEISKPFETAIESRTGQERWYHWVVMLSPDDGMAFVSGRETTDRHRNETLKDEFISTVSHELRTPLTALRGALSHLTRNPMEGVGDIDRFQLLKIADRNSERLARLVNNLLDLQELESGEIDQSFTSVGLSEVIRQVMSDCEPLTAEKGVTISLADRANGPIVLGNSSQLTRVVTNLLSNAIKIAPLGSNIGIELADGGEHVQLLVHDEGSGIPESVRSRMFERFVRSGDAGGTGLGLSIVKGLVEQHRGTISFTTNEGKGTTFIVTLPRYRHGANVIPLPQTDSLH
jgi:PAS domain S-box-containing protein